MGNEEYTKKKNRKKVFRVIVQLLILAAIGYVVAIALFTFTTYKPYDTQRVTVNGDKGFIALSYFGVERVSSTKDIIGVDRLRRHLDALRQAGFVTITQQDIVDYYDSGKILPERSLFISFEDGRRDTAIFTQKLLEKINYRANMMTYAENLNSQDPKFLNPSELLELEKTTYWGLGTNGYRLFFINVFDRYHNYLGELSPLEYVQVNSFLGRRYNHYLMDYIRDEFDFPIESYGKMKRRIDYDYEALRDAYTETIGKVPGMYVLMHSNTGSFGNHDKVSAINKHWITDLFQMNFNREGFSLNERNSGIYDLTRMQPQAYWYPNHLIMRIKDDNKQDLPFVIGDSRRHAFWDVKKGALEVETEKIILTSEPESVGLMRLRDVAAKDIKLSVRMLGNKFGKQSILLRTDESYNNFVAVQLLNNYLYIVEKIGGTEKELFKLNLDEHDGKPVFSIPEDKKQAEVAALEAIMRYASNKEKVKIYAQRLLAKKQEQVPSVADGAPAYIPVLSMHELGNRLVHIDLKDGLVNVMIDEKPAAKNVAITNQNSGSIAVETIWGGYGWSQRNLADDVYDGVFEQLLITTNTGASQETVIFEDKLDMYDAYMLKLKKSWESLLDIFITHF